MAELRALYVGVQNLAELSPRTLDAIAGVGERLSFELMAAGLEAWGIPARAVDARKVVITDDRFGSAAPLMPEIAARVQELVRPLVHRGVVPVLPGYIGGTRGGIATTLGRGGSDWSASLIGAALPAKAIEIWTDVDGLMTADPRVVREARVIPEVSFAEAAELAYFGARVLHPATIKPAVEQGIPVWILNSMNPGAPGTRISAQAADVSGLPAAISFRRGVSVVSITQPRMPMAQGFLTRVFEVFARHRLALDLIASSEESVSVTLNAAASLQAIEADLAQLGEVRVQRRMAVVSLVGRGFVQRAGMAAWIFQAVRGVNIAMISFGASEMNVSFVVDEQQCETAVRALHQELFGANSVEEVPAELAAAAARIPLLEGAS
jgi:aspartate kinase